MQNLTLSAALSWTLQIEGEQILADCLVTSVVRVRSDKRNDGKSYVLIQKFRSVHLL
jgi:hypothetical protein